MALDRQTDFSGGLNTRIPAHKIPDNMVQSASNVDFSHGDIRPDDGIGGDGGGKDFFYEKGSTWVSTDGIGGTTSYPITIIESSTTSTVTTNTDIGNPLLIKADGTYQVGTLFTFTVNTSTEVLTLNATHGIANGSTVKVSSSTTIPAGLAVATTYYVINASGADLKLSATLGGTAINITSAGSGTHNIWATSGTVANSVTVNDTQQGLGSVSSFVEYNDDLYMGRDYFQITKEKTSGSAEIEFPTATDITKIIVGDSVDVSGIPKDSIIESIDYGNSKAILNKNATATSASILASINTTPIRIIDGILSKVYPIEVKKPAPFGFEITQITGESNTERAEGHSVMWYTANFPVPFQWGIARFDDATGSESGMSDLSSMSLSQANISPTLTSVPVFTKMKISKEDCNTELYGRFALYRVGGTSTVLKKVHDIYLTAQEDGSPLSVSVTLSTNNIIIQAAGLPTGAEWKIKWFGYGPASTRKSYTSKGLGSITITDDGDNYTSAPSVVIAAPTGSGGKQATATAVITSQKLTNIIIIEKGSGYEATPAVTFTGGGGSGAAATAVVEPAVYQGESTLSSTVSTNIAVYGSSASHYIDFHFIVKFTSDAIDSVTGAPFSDDYREYLFASTNVTGTSITGDSGLLSHDGCGSTINFTPPRALIEIEPIQDPTSIPYNLQYLTEFNNFFIGAKEKRLHISNYAKPNNFAIDGYMDFEAQITGIGTRGGEALVFTEYGVHRVYGNAHNEMRKVKVPTIEGIPMGGHRTISNIRNSVIYVSHSGICMFDGNNVTVLTESLIQDFSTPSATPKENVAAVFNDVYYLLTSGSIGWKVDMRHGSPKISRSTLNASNMQYRALTNKLYTESGYIGGSTLPNKFSFETRDFTGGDITSEKAYSTVYVTGSDFSGTINIKCDGTLIDTYNYPVPISEFNRALSISTAKVANRASVEFIDCTGKVQSIQVKYDPLSEQTKRRYNSVTLTYTGTPTVIVKIDSVEKIESTTLTSPGIGNTGTATLYFPSMTEGHVPHLVTDETETSRISGTVFDTEAI